MRMSAFIPPVSRLSSRIIRVLGCNPGPMTLQGTNTYLIGEGGRRILLDAGDANVAQYITNLKEILREENAVIHKIIITHWHHDHIGGVPDVIKANGICEVAKLKRSDFPEDGQISGNIPIKFINHGDVIETDGATLRVHHTPGHTVDHIVLVLKEENALFSGDCILGEGTAVFEDLSDYIKSLEEILKLDPKIIYPGHGPMVENPSPKIKYYINHRMERERQIFEFMKKNPGKRVTTGDIVKSVYKDTPVHLHPAAEVNVGHHLSKLEKEGKIRSEKDGWIFHGVSSAL